MSREPTYEDLLRRIRELETESATRDLAEETSRESEEKYRTLFENMTQGAFRQRADGSYVDINPAALGMFGLTKKEFLGRTSESPEWDVVREDGSKAPGAEHPSMVALRTGSPVLGEVLGVINERTGERVWMEINAIPEFLPEKSEPCRVMVTMHDITERKRAEEEKERLQAQLANAVEMARLGPWEYDVATDLFTFNDHFYKIFRITAEQVGGYKMSSAEYARRFLHPDDISGVAEVIRKSIEATDSNSGQSLERRVLYADGTVGYISVRIFIVKDDHGKTIKTYGVNQDITERKRAEEALRESEEKYRELYEEAPVGYMEFDANGYITRVNRRELQMLGYSAEEMIGQQAWSFVLEKEKGRDLIKAKLAGESPPSKNLERTYVRKDGTTFPGLINDVVFKDKVGRIIGIRSTIQDISQRKQAEEALRQSEERLRLALKAANQGTYDLNVQTGEAIVSPEYARMLGYEPHEFQETHEAWHDRLHPNDCNLASHAYEESISGLRDEYKVEYRQQAQTGEWRWILSQGKVVERDEKGRPLRMLGTHTDITDRKRIEEALTESEEKYRQLFDLESDALFLVENNTANFLEANRAACALYGYTREELLSKRTTELSAEPEETRRAVCAKLSHIPMRLHRRKDGTIFPVELTASYFQWGGRDVHMVAMRDISRRVRAEEEKARVEGQLRQSQKLEALGTLAGGVAHDFNNLLTVITGNADLLLMDTAEDHPFYKSVEEIRQAGLRAASLTRQLLAFCRKQIVEPRVLILNDILKGTEKMLGRLIGENIRLEVEQAPDLWQVEVDPGQMEQVIVNLAVNARDAMPQGGRLIVSTRNVQLNAKFFRDRGVSVAPGSYVLLEVSDTGTGMTPEIQERIFEPFFTTKEVGKGTGLGLSTVYGIVKQSGGFIFVWSELGKGATFEIYLPKATAKEGKERHSESVSGDLTGSETVLLVEDDDRVRGLVSAVLAGKGYRVLQARSGEDALLVNAGHSGPIDLLLTDVVMPGMNGKELVDRLASLRREMHVLYMSGYMDDSIAYYGVLKPGITLLQKPFTADVLARKIREILGKD